MLLTRKKIFLLFYSQASHANVSKRGLCYRLNTRNLFPGTQNTSSLKIKLNTTEAKKYNK